MDAPGLANGMLTAMLWGGIAAASLLIGYFLAAHGLSNRTIGLVMGIGAGALISAIAYELVPESVMEGWDIAFAFAGVGSIFLRRSDR
jgi:ZIP family zinc transporter